MPEVRVKKKKNWKTWTGAVGGMLLGAGAVAAGVAKSSYDMVWAGLTGIVASLTLVGIGHKIQKFINIIDDYIKKFKENDT